MKCLNLTKIVLLVFFIIAASSIFVAGCGKSDRDIQQTEMKKEEKTTTPSVISDTSKMATIYTCPMHPDVQQNYPGKCQKCNMDLEMKKDKKDVIEGNIFTCEMHPEIIQNYPGKCPKCKMDMILKKSDRK